MAEQIINAIQSALKRIVCLYRVSTVGQVEKDDIPMQKQFCREFCLRQPGWEIVKEFSDARVIISLNQQTLVAQAVELI